MKKLKQINAFTMAELMVVMFIISVVIIITMLAQKPNDKVMGRLYQRAYSALSTAVYNVKLDLATGETFPATPADLCTKLADPEEGFINVATGTVNCAAPTVSLMANSFPDSSIMFTTANGMRAYISPVSTWSVVINSVTQPVTAFVVFFDLNGSKKPNTAVSTTTQMADIVGFIVTTEADVIPIGTPEIDTKYMTARVHYPDGTTAAEVDRYSISMSYYDAKSTAWGQGASFDEVQSIDFSQFLPAGSNIKITYPASPVPATMVNTSMKCVLNTATAFSPCEVDIDQYYN